MNKQRAIIYRDRRDILEGKFDSKSFMTQTIAAKVNEALEQNAPENVHPSEWDFAEMLEQLELIFPVKQAVAVEDLESKDREEVQSHAA